MKRPITTHIVVHGTYTPPAMNVLIDEVRRWHVEERGWKDVGYHFLITRSGLVQGGRPLTDVGAHVNGFNDQSVGIALAGGMREDLQGWDANYTAIQYSSLIHLVHKVREVYPTIREIVGHRDAPGALKECPGFDVRALFEREAR